MRDGGGVHFFTGVTAGFHQFLVRLLFDLRAQFAFLHGFDGARGFLFVFLDGLRKLLLEFFQARALTAGPFRLQPSFFFREILSGKYGLAFQRFKFVAAAMQIRN